jgi:tyrosine-protein phosphatase SIW14
VPPNRPASERPAAIDQYLRVLDDPASYPILIHCRAGLHRTGLFTAIYRMEKQHWAPLQAWLEMKANGFGELNCFADNPYVTQYLLTYQPGVRCAVPAGTSSEPAAKAYRNAAGFIP